MKKFDFKLAPLLKYREEIEHLRQKELVIAHNQLQHLRDRLTELNAINQNIMEKVRKKEGPIIDPREFSSTFEFLNTLGKRMKTQETEILKAQQRVEEKRKAVISAMQKRKIVENLQEKQYAAWDYEIQEQEKSFFDELATIRYMRDKLKH